MKKNENKTENTEVLFEKETDDKKSGKAAGTEASSAENEAAEEDAAPADKDETADEGAAAEKDDPAKDTSGHDDSEEKKDGDELDLPPVKKIERIALTPEEAASNKRILILEIAVAAAALIIIVVAIILKSGKNEADGELPDNGISVSASENNAANNASVSEDIVEIDNSALFVGIPPIPEQAADELPDYDKLLEEKHVLKLTSENGGTVYVHDYTNSAYFLEQCRLPEDEVDNEIRKNYLSSYITENDTKNTVAQLYDSVKIDYLGKKDGVAFDGGTDQDVELIIGVSPFIDGFTEGVIGMKEGETKDVHVVFPKDYGQPDLAGQPAVFTITLKEILHGNTIPELTDELANEITGGEHTTAESMRAYVRDMLQSEKIWNFIDTDFYVEKISEEEVMDSYNLIMKQYDESSQMYQVSVEEMLLGAYGVTLDEFKTEIMGSAATTIRRNTLYRTIAKKENITVDDADIEQLVKDMAYTGTTAEFIEQYGEDNVRNHILQNKLMEHLIGLLENAESVSGNEAGSVSSDEAVSENEASGN